MRTVRCINTIVAVLFVFFQAGCSEESNPVEAEERLCGGEAGLAARIKGRAAPVDFCVQDDRVVESVEKGVLTIFTIQNRYAVTASMTGPDGTEYEIQMLLPHKSEVPKALNITGNQAQAEADPDGVWFYYQEIPPTGDALESVAVTGGTFTLSFSDTEVAAGTFAGVSLEMQTQNTNTAAGTRGIPEGFFSISTDV